MKNLVVFDGVCVFCSRLVQFVLRHESDHVLRFTPMQSATGARLMRELGIDPEDAETFVLISEDAVFVKSDAALELTKHLGGAWKVLSAFRVLPRGLRDWGYDIFARNRYRWFGRYDECMLPSPGAEARFILD